MLAYSYKVELQRLRATMMALEHDLALNPENARARDKLAEMKQQATWFAERIASGDDPGPRTL